MRKILVVLGMALLASFLQGQTVSPAGNRRETKLRAQMQSACEKRMLRSPGVKEVLGGPEYEVLLDVAAAFGREKPPRLYFVPGDGTSAYIAGSVSLDGRGKILMSKEFAGLMGKAAPALKGVMAHEMAHLVLDIPGRTACNQWIYRDLEGEEAADALAAKKVGPESVRDFLLVGEKLMGAENAEMTLRLRALEKLEAQGNKRR